MPQICAILAHTVTVQPAWRSAVRTTVRTNQTMQTLATMRLPLAQIALDPPDYIRRAPAE